MRAERAWSCVFAVSALVTLGAASVGAPAPVPAPGPVGNVSPMIDPAARGVSVAAAAAPVDDRVAVLIQNGSGKAARIDLVTATATSADGTVVTRARSVEAFPQVVAPGGLALASVQFRRNDASPGATIVVKVRSTPVKAATAARALSVSNTVLSVPKRGAIAQTLDATVTNGATNWTARGSKVAVMCFGEARQPTTITTGRLDPARLPSGKQATVSVPLTTLCPTYLVAARAS